MTIARAATAARRAAGDIASGHALRAFYAAVLSVALVGSAMAAEDWLGWWLWAALAAVSLYELGGVALAIFADRRRQKGERAVFARIVSAGFAAGAVAVNLLGHQDADGNLTGPGYFFAGFSLAGYVIWLLDAEARRRDALRSEGKLAETPPAYGLYQWARHPWLTRRSRSLAVDRAEQRLVERVTSREQGGPDLPVTPMLGRAGSLSAARAQLAEQRRLAAIRTALRSRIAAGVDPTMARIAVHTYDLGRVAAGLADAADYPALTGLLGRELVPARIADAVTSRRRRWRGLPRRPATQTAQTAPAPLVDSAQPAWPGSAPDGTRLLPLLPLTAPNPKQQDGPPPGAVSSTQTAPTLSTSHPVSTPQTDANGNEHAGRPPAFAPVEPYMLAHLARVMTYYPDWDDAIVRPNRHPEALTLAKIKDAAGFSGQQTASDVRLALLSMRGEPEAALAYVQANTPTAVTHGN
jgi:hypothetical protein